MNLRLTSSVAFHHMNTQLAFGLQYLGNPKVVLLSTIQYLDIAVNKPMRNKKIPISHEFAEKIFQNAS